MVQLCQEGVCVCVRGQVIQVGKQTACGTSRAVAWALEEDEAGMGLRASFLSAVYRLTHAPYEVSVLPRPSDAALGLPFGASSRVLQDPGCTPFTFPQSRLYLRQELVLEGEPCLLASFSHRQHPR